jgi:hypothetical protein
MEWQASCEVILDTRDGIVVDVNDNFILHHGRECCYESIYLVFGIVWVPYRSMSEYFPDDFLK